MQDRDSEGHDSFVAWREYLIRSIDDLTENQKTLWGEITRLKLDMAIEKTRWAIISTTLAIASSAAVNFVLWLMERGK